MKFKQMRTNITRIIDPLYSSAGSNALGKDLRSQIASV